MDNQLPPYYPEWRVHGQGKVMHKGILGFVITLALGASGAAQAEGAFSARVGAGLGSYQFDDVYTDTIGAIGPAGAEYKSDDSDSTFGLLGGMTLGVGRFYGDLGLEVHTFSEGDDLDGDGVEDDTFRSDLLLNLGYFIGDRWVAFIGYRHATFGDGAFSDTGGNTEDGPFFGGGFSFRAGEKLSFGASLAYNALTLKIDGTAIDDLDLNGISAKLQMNILDTPHSVFLRWQRFNGTIDEPGFFEYEYTENYLNLGYQATFDLKSW